MTNIHGKPPKADRVGVPVKYGSTYPTGNARIVPQKLTPAQIQAALNSPPIEWNQDRHEYSLDDGLIRINNFGGNCPVQAEGYITCQEQMSSRSSHNASHWMEDRQYAFYFRALGDKWSLRVSNPGVDPVENAFWMHVEDWGEDQLDAGYMPTETAVAMIRKAVYLFLLRNPDDTSPD